MGKFFGKLIKALKAEEEETAEDIDKALAADVKRISEEKLKSLLADEVLGGGWGEKGDMVYILNLAPVYEMIGGRGGRLAATLMETCENLFKQNLGSLKGRCFDQGSRFYMRFAGASQSEGWNCAAIIVNAIGTRLLGDRFEEMEIPEVMVMARPDDLTASDGTLDPDKVTAFVEAGGHAPEGGSGGAFAEPKWEELLWGEGGEVDAEWWRQFDFTAQPGGEAGAQPGGATGAQPGGKGGATPDKAAPKKLPIEALFRPTWAPARDTLSHVICCPQLNTSRGAMVGEVAYPKADGHPLIAIIDGTLAVAAARALTAMDEGAPEIGVIVPIRFATLFGSEAGRVVKVLKGVPEAVRKRRMIIELTAIPEKAVQSQLGEAVRWARGFAASVIVRVDASAKNLEAVNKAGVTVVSFDLSAAENGGGPVAREGINAMAKQANAAKLACYLWGATRPEEVEAAARAGFSLVNGPAVAREKPAVGAPRPFSRADMPAA